MIKKAVVIEVFHELNKAKNDKKRGL